MDEGFKIAQQEEENNKNTLPSKIQVQGVIE